MTNFIQSIQTIPQAIVAAAIVLVIGAIIVTWIKGLF